MKDPSHFNFEVPEVCYNLNERLGTFYYEMNSQTESSEEKLEGKSRYKIKEKIASGGLKDIFRAFDKKSCRNVAIAFLREDLELTENLESFIRECKITALLEHPNIIPVYDVDEQEKPFFTMKLVHGEDLSFYIFKNPEILSRNELLRIFLKICDAISYAHSRGVVHLDIKPENIRIDNYGEVLVHDWGLSKRIFIPEGDENKLPKDSITISSYITGTPSYMAPEQFDPTEICDERTDIFSLGSLLFSILTFTSPFSSDINVESRKYTHPSHINPNIPQSLCAIVEKSLKKEPCKRYQTVNEMKVDIKCYLDGFPTTAEKASFLTQLHLLFKRNKKICLNILCSLMIIIALISVFITKIKDSEVKTKQALAEAQKAKIKTEKALNESRENFDLFVKEKAYVKEVSQVSSASLSLADIMPNRVNYRTSMQQLETALKISPYNEEIHRRKLLLHLYHEEFEKAFNEYNYSTHPEFISSAIEVILHLKLQNSNKKLPIDDFINLIKHLRASNCNWIANVLCLSRVNYTKGKEHHLKLMEALFKVSNLHQEKWNFEYKSEDGVLFSYFKIKDAHKIYSYCALSGRYISILDVSNAKNFFTSDIALVYIKKIIAYNVKIHDVKKLKRVDGLEEIIVKKGQLSKEEKESLSFLKITELD